MPANLGIPPWLQPPDVAGSFLGGARIGLGQAQIGQEANRLQLMADQTTQQQMEDQQRLAIEHQYQQQQISLKRQELAQKQQMNQIAVQEAARQSQAMLGYNRDLQGIEGRADLTPDQKEQAKIGLMMKYGPQMSDGRMSGLGTMMSAMYRQRIPPPTWVPPNTQTGEPGHWVTHSGDVHLPQQMKAQTDPGSFIDKDTYSKLLSTITQLEDDISTKKYSGKELEDAKVRLANKMKEKASLEAKYGRGAAPATEAGGTDVVFENGRLVFKGKPSAAPAKKPATAPASALPPGASALNAINPGAWFFDPEWVAKNLSEGRDLKVTGWRNPQ